MNPISITITEENISRATRLARKCSSEVARERTLVSQAVLEAFRGYLISRGITANDGRSASPRFLDLLDICDLTANGWPIEVRTVIKVDEPGLYVPTMPLMVGVLSDFYVSAQVSRVLREVTILGWASQEALGSAELTANGLFAVVAPEDLRSVNDLVETISMQKRSDPEIERLFGEWQKRACRIIQGLTDLLTAEGVFSPEQIECIAAGIHDEVVRIWGTKLPATGLESLIDRLFRRFGVDKPVPAAPESPVRFSNPAASQAIAKGTETKLAFFRDQLAVNERIPLYRHLLEDTSAFEEHRRAKRTLDYVTKGKHQISSRRRARIRSEKQREAESVLINVERYIEPFDYDDPHGPSYTGIPPAMFGGALLAAETSSSVSFSETDLESEHQRNDFSTDPEIVRLVVEAERLSYGHLFNPAFATEISLIDPLPHQRIAVYEHMLMQTRLRFLLADDAGAGKTIMAGLYIREMLTRRLINRVLIIPPAGLVGNWVREMHNLFSLPFIVITGKDAKSDNPFIGAESNLLIVSIDTLAGDRMFSRFQESSVSPYDLVIFDEAHKLSADREPDLSLRKTDRYRLAETIAGVPIDDDRWKLEWRAHHLLLLTATPHMGKDFPYYCLWRLLEPDVLSTYTAFSAYPKEARARHFIRRSKEEMVRYDGTPIYPTRISDTLSFDLTQGEISEQRLYDATTHYIEAYYNRARILNRSAARLAMTVFQRRLVSSTWALLRSFARRSQKLTGYIEDIRSGRISLEVLRARQRKLDELPDVLDEKTADEELADEDCEENEKVEDQAMGGVVAVSLGELEAERIEVVALLELARKVHDAHTESKFEKLREVISSPSNAEQKLIIFTEYRDTLDFLVRRLEGLGFTGQVAKISGLMDYRQRDEMVEFFRRPIVSGGARFLVATDAAGEGINLQFCWSMVNYDIPWNPARLEQRMGRIHRYGQQHDPVIITNLVAGQTREGRVMKTLLTKLERIRSEMGSDKVFDVIGRLFESVSLKAYMEQAVTEKGAEQAQNEIEGTLTKEQVIALKEREKRLLGDGGDVRPQLARLTANVDQEIYRRMLPGYVRRFVERAAPLLNIKIEGDIDSTFLFRPALPGALDPLLSLLESYSAVQRENLTFRRPESPDASIWLHPGEPLFERFRAHFLSRYRDQALRGGMFIDAEASTPYLYYLALIAVERMPDCTLPELSQRAMVEYRPVGLRQYKSGEMEECPIEHLLLLRNLSSNGSGPQQTTSSELWAQSDVLRQEAHKFTIENVIKPLANKWRGALLLTLPEREDFVRRGYDYQDAELAERRSQYTDRARAGDPKAQGEITKIKNRQRQLESKRREALSVLKREPELIAPGDTVFLAQALIVPSRDPLERKHRDDQIELMAMQVARAYEESYGAMVKDVSKPELARAAGLMDNPGFDLEARRCNEEPRAIEVKGRASTGQIELTENEWVRACNLRQRYWLYVVYDCGGSHPRLLRVQDPFSKLIVKGKGSVVVDEGEIFQAAEAE